MFYVLGNVIKNVAGKKKKQKKQASVSLVKGKTQSMNKIYAEIRLLTLVVE